MKCSISELLGKTIISVTGAETGGDEIIFKCSDGSVYRMYHEQDCCEAVYVEDICGTIDDILNIPLTMAEEISDPMGEPSPSDFAYDCSWTWTYYKFASVKGYVTIRWYGESNGYYSERVDFERMEEQV